MRFENAVEAIALESYAERTNALGAEDWEVVSVLGPVAVQAGPLMQAQSLTEQSGKIIQAQAAVKPGFFVFLKRPIFDARETENLSPQEAAAEGRAWVERTRYAVEAENASSEHIVAAN